MKSDDDGTDESAIQAMAIFTGRSDAANEFFAHIGAKVIEFALANDLDTDELAVSLGWLAGSMSLTVMRANPEYHIEAADEYVRLCVSGLELGAAKARITQEDARPPPRTGHKRRGPSNG